MSAGRAGEPRLPHVCAGSGNMSRLAAGRIKLHGQETRTDRPGILRGDHGPGTGERGLSKFLGER